MPKRKIKWDERRSAAVSAHRVLPPLVAAYFDQVRRFLAKAREPKELHRIRLASKRLRYTLELFIPCYGPGLAQRLDALKKLQVLLGQLNDAVATRALLGDSVNPKVLHFLDALAAEKADEFCRHWKKSFDAPDQENWWTVYLQRNTRMPKAPAPNTRRAQSEPRP